MIETAPGPSVVLLVIQGLVCILEDGTCGGRPVREGCARAEGYLGQTVVLVGQGPVDGIHLLPDGIVQVAGHLHRDDDKLVPAAAMT